MGRKPLTGASLGSTGQSHSNPHLTRREQYTYDALRSYGISHGRIMYGIMWDRGNERLAAHLKTRMGHCGSVGRGS